MTSERHSKAGEIFLEARALPESERAAFIERACRGDEALRREVESLLAHDLPGDDPTIPLEKGGDEVSRRMIAETSERAIGGYRVVHEIGRGGMGVVYLGVREGDEFKRPVAIKVLKRGLDTEDVLARFDLERQVLAAMNHPGIARLYDAGETDEGLPYFVMEYVEGLDLAEYCDKHRLNIGERLALFQKVCAAVHYAHQNLIVHRDLKPRNIVVTGEGQPKLLDFGIAKLIKPELSILMADPTLPGARVMTPEYASPEQVRGDPISTASDVYTLGVILYELLCGHRPYRLLSRVASEIERVICEEEPERPSTAISRVEEIEVFDAGIGTGTGTRTITPESVSKTRAARPERLRRQLAGDIDNIVMMAMRKESQRRYASAEQMASDIQRYLDGMPVTARPDTLGYRMSKFVRRNRAGVAAAAVMVVLLIGGIASTTREWQRAEAERLTAIEAQEQAEADRRQFLSIAARAVESATLGEGRPLSARESLLRETIEHLRAMPRLDDDTLALLASALEALGDVQGGHGLNNLGQVEAAEKSYREALAIREELAEAGDPAALAHLTDTRLDVGDAILNQSTWEAALPWKRRALEGIEPAAQAKGAPIDVRRAYGVAMSEVGSLLVKKGAIKDTIDLYEKTYVLRRQLVKEAPGDIRLQRDLAMIAQWLGSRLVRRGDVESALPLLKESVAIRERLVTEQAPDRVLFREERLARWDLGKCLQGMGDYQGAIEQFNRCLQTPELDETTLVQLSNVSQSVGALLAEQGRHEEAVAQLDRGLAFAGILLDRSPRAEPSTSILLQIQIGQTWIDARRFDLAAEPARTALAACEARAAQGEGQNWFWEWDLAAARSNYAMVLTGTDEADAAHDLLDKSVLDFDRLLKGKELSDLEIELRKDAAFAYMRLSRVLAERSNVLGAIKYAEKALATAPMPTVDLLLTLADAHYIDGNATKAIESVTEAQRQLDADPPYNADEIHRSIDETLERYLAPAAGG